MVSYDTTVFKTVAFNRSANPPSVVPIVANALCRVNQIASESASKRPQRAASH